MHKWRKPRDAGPLLLYLHTRTVGALHVSWGTILRWLGTERVLDGSNGFPYRLKWNSLWAHWHNGDGPFSGTPCVGG